MPGNEVTGIAQDGSGFLWVAYLNGLAKFDGVRFQNVRLPIPPEREFTIRKLLRTSGDRFWLALDGGTVISIAPDRTNVFTAADGLSAARPINLVENRDGAIWIGYSDSSACRIFGKEISRYDSANGLAKTGNCRLATDTEGNLWFGQTGRVGLWGGGRFQTLLNLPAQHVRVGKARHGGIWICADNKIFSYRKGGQLLERADLGFDIAQVLPETTLEDRSGALWLGTYGGGLFRCGETNFESVEISQRTVLSLFEDREGSVWVGTAGGGLNRVRPTVLELHDMESGLPFETARSICVDSTGRIWVAGRNGALAWREKNSWHLCDANDGWDGDLATCVANDSQGAVWIGTYQRDALYHWQNGSFTKLDHSSGLGGKTVRLLMPDRDGNLWVGLNTPSGLQRLKNGTFQNFELPRGSGAICAGAIAADGNVWFGTTSGSLLRVDGNHLVDETHRALSERRSITSLQATTDGSLWIGYFGAGIGRLRANGFRHIAPEQGLPSGRIDDTMLDNRGWFWFSTDQGILRVSKADMDAVADGREKHLDAIYYGSDELVSLQAYSPYFPGAARQPNGNILFPLLTGLAVVHPDRFSTNKTPPQVIIESAIADDESPAQPAKDGVLHFGPGLRKLEFQFTAPSFIAPSSIRFRHKLEGVDEDWIDLGTQRRVTYTRLPPGKYNFRVTACNYAGVWNDVGAVAAFEVEPFFWETTSFKIASVILLPLCLVGLVRYLSTRRLRHEMRQLQQEAALDRERARIAKDIHDDLGASLTQISILSEIATRQLPPANNVGGHVRKLAQTARLAFTSLDEIVWAVNPRNDTLANLLDYLAQFALDFLSPTPIRCRLDFPSQPPDCAVSSEVRHTLYLVVREALNNIVKHARATEVHLRAALVDGALHLCIEDNGVGFDSLESQPEADGLLNMRQRLTDVGGKFRIESRRGSGTIIRIETPLQRSLNLTSADRSI